MQQQETIPIPGLEAVPPPPYRLRKACAVRKTRRRHRCGRVTSSGFRCPRTVPGAGLWCWMHGEEDPPA